jgi:hypothetical protein
MLICAGLAVASAAVARLLIPDPRSLISKTPPA